jgi:hypothetical protein
VLKSLAIVGSLELAFQQAQLRISKSNFFNFEAALARGLLTAKRSGGR